jgi:hypothetical protein
MTRYALSITTTKAEPLYLAASYETTGSGIRITDRAEDACSYVTFEQAASVARQLKDTFHGAPQVIEVGY